MNSHWRNLAYGTRKENAEDMVRHGTRKRGMERHNAKLTDDLVREIRAAEGSLSQLAKRFGVDFSHIGRIRRREIWTHVEDR